MSTVAFLVAVAVTVCPTPTAFSGEKTKVAVPLVSVETTFWLTSLLPSFVSCGLDKNWRVMVLSGVLASLPLMVVLPETVLAEAMYSVGAAGCAWDACARAPWETPPTHQAHPWCASETGSASPASQTSLPDLMPLATPGMLLVLLCPRIAQCPFQV